VTSTCIQEFIAKIRMLAGVPVITHIRPKKNAHDTPADQSAPITKKDSAPVSQQASSSSSKVFAIASSTGGPQVLATILTQLPENFPCPVFVAQHISEGFASGMADWLSQLCKLPVKIAQNGEKILAGTIYIAPAESHCTVLPTRRIALIHRNEKDIYRPSCDRLLGSVADVYQDNAVGIILTGMGRDGALGIAKILAKGGVTLGQDEATSLIYGMNRYAISSGSVQKVLPVNAIASEMLDLAGL
jgi:two-component system, chemotaxis family, protein-glutamate methylesterase/glutaminase